MRASMGAAGGGVAEMGGCWVDDHQLIGWERALVSEYSLPRWGRDGRRVWDLDALPAYAVRALCRPRVGALAGTAGYGSGGTAAW